MSVFLSCHDASICLLGKEFNMMFPLVFPRFLLLLTLPYACSTKHNRRRCRRLVDTSNNDGSARIESRTNRGQKPDSFCEWRLACSVANDRQEIPSHARSESSLPVRRLPVAAVA